MNSLQRQYAFGQAVWLKHTYRELLASGEFESLIESGLIHGAVFDPILFHTAVERDEYDPMIRPRAQLGWECHRIYEDIAIEDIRLATRRLLPLYEQSSGLEGFVSVAVNPLDVQDLSQYMAEVRRLWTVINRPNLMIQIPAIQLGLQAIEQATCEGINVHVAMVFSLAGYADVLEAYLRGLERRAEEGLSLNHVSSVASIGISDVDTEIDRRLREIILAAGPNAPRATALLGKAALANAKLAYLQFEIVLNSVRFRNLQEKGGKIQRLLWTSTSVENPDYPDAYYVDALVGPHTITSLTAETIRNISHGVLVEKLGTDLGTSRAHLSGLETLGIHIDEVTEDLESIEMDRYRDSFNLLLATIEERARKHRSEIGPLAHSLKENLERVSLKDVTRRIWERDVSLWSTRRKDAPVINDGLAWLDVSNGDFGNVIDRQFFQNDTDKYLGLLTVGRDALPSLILSGVQSVSGEPVRLLQSLDPLAIQRFTRKTPINQSKFTVVAREEEDAYLEVPLHVTWRRAVNRMKTGAADRFLILSPPESILTEFASEHGIPNFEINNKLDPRFSPFNTPSLALASIMGVDVERVLEGVKNVAESCKAIEGDTLNPGVFLGCLLAAASTENRANLALYSDPGFELLKEWFGDCLRGLRSERNSVLRVFPDCPVRCASRPSRWFRVYLRSSGDWDDELGTWSEAGVPSIVIDVDRSPGHLGNFLFVFQFALLVTTHLMGANPFGSLESIRQNVETRNRFSRYLTEGERELPAHWRIDGIQVWANPQETTIESGWVNEGLVEVLLHHIEKCESIALHLHGFRARKWKQRIRIMEDGFSSLGKAVLRREGVKGLLSLNRNDRDEERILTLIFSLEVDSDLAIPDRAFSFSKIQRTLIHLTIEKLAENQEPAFALTFTTTEDCDRFLERFTDRILLGQ